MEFLSFFENSLVKAEEKDCFKKKLLPHVPILYKSAIRWCGNPDNAQDMIQETLYLAIKNYNQLKDPEKVKYWMFSILRNQFLKDIQKNKKRAEIEFDSICDRLSSEQNIETEVLRAELKRNILNILNKLEDKLRLPLIKFFFDGLSYKEIAETMNIPIGTVMSRIARAKVHLKKELLRSSFIDSRLNNNTPD
ncbi:MAG: sigma-70 family RNA polymerase sigma factor [Nitrospinae bacterium]|nr:sigma-70 family RNA polymerase sigma factor [Nitrospinota bacterium]MZH42328.1 sigma-70 family RNA polymerase sigma factor [Nitrospinota bacterium]